MYGCANIHVFADSSLPADYAVIFVEAASLNVRRARHLYRIDGDFGQMYKFKCFARWQNI